VTKHWGLEYSPESGYRGNKADFCGDAAYLPLPDESVDTILCTEVMEHVPDPEKTIQEFARVLRPGGTVIVTAPFFYPVHDAYDFFRYSPDGIAAIMKRHGLIVESVDRLSGGPITLAIMFNLLVFDLGFLWTKWLYPFGLLLRPLIWLATLIVNCAGWLLEKLIPSPQMAFNHLTIARKS
jgi:SAM-dependent methyltransferase